jgi:2-(1,2-epoxy-1,2-dihydrophenyl)acetyl-CoA isomerase
MRGYKTDTAVRAIIITGSGRSFCAGGDISSMKAERSVDVSRSYFLDSVNHLPEVVRDIEKPVIAAVNGFAIGAGCTFALACDLIIASDRAVFGIPFTRIGLGIDAGGTYLLSKAIGLAKAKELAFTGRNVSAEEAERIGLINRVVPHDQLLESTEALAREIIALPRVAIGVTKKLLNLNADRTLAEALESEAFAQAHCMALPDHLEGVSAFLEKRAPVFEK